MTLLSPTSGDPLSARTIPVGYAPTTEPVTIYVENESTGLSALDAWRLRWALQYQTRFQFARAWGLGAEVIFSDLPPGIAIPKGGIVLHLTDTLDVAGALGYHDEDGAEVPYARVGVKTSRNDNVQPSAVASHEALELLVDLHVNLTAINEAKLQAVAYEVGDAAQSNDYDVGAPEGRQTGTLVADFCLPSWFDPNTPASAKTSYRGALKGPFTVGPGGYHAYIDLRDAVNPDGTVKWQQAFGQDHVSAGAAPVVNPE